MSTASISLRALDPAAASTFTVLRGAVLGAPRYARAFDGRAPGDDDVRELMASLPPGCRPSQKVLMAIEEEGAVIGCISLVRGWPTTDAIHVGLLLLIESRQGQGHGPAAWAA